MLLNSLATLFYIINLLSDSKQLSEQSRNFNEMISRPPIHSPRIGRPRGAAGGGFLARKPGLLVHSPRGRYEKFLFRPRRNSPGSPRGGNARELSGAGPPPPLAPAAAAVAEGADGDRSPEPELGGGGGGGEAGRRCYSRYRRRPPPRVKVGPAIRAINGGPLERPRCRVGPGNGRAPRVAALPSGPQRSPAQTEGSGSCRVGPSNGGPLELVCCRVGPSALPPKRKAPGS